MARAENRARATPALPAVVEGVSPLDYRKQKSTLGFARKEPHDCGLLRPAGAGSRDLLAMTSHNGCTKQRRLILPLSASGVLRQGRCPALRSGAICCIELCDVMPSPKRGQVPRQAAKYAAVRSGHERPCIVACRPRRRLLRATRHHAAGDQKIYAAPCSGAVGCLPRLHVRLVPRTRRYRAGVHASSGDGAHPSRQTLRA